MKQLTCSMIMGLLCVMTLIIAAPILNQENIHQKEKKVDKIMKERIASEAQTLTML